VAPPGGESIAAATRRVLPALGRVLEQPPATVLVVSHVTPMKIVLRHALLAPPPAVRRMHLDVACLCEIDWFDEGLGVVRSLNDTGHLQPGDRPATATARQTADDRTGRTPV
jgi:probable phosphoglycerate mutase